MLENKKRGQRNWDGCPLGINGIYRTIMRLASGNCTLLRMKLDRFVLYPKVNNGGFWFAQNFSRRHKITLVGIQHREVWRSRNYWQGNEPYQLANTVSLVLFGLNFNRPLLLPPHLIRQKSWNILLMSQPADIALVSLVGDNLHTARPFVLGLDDGSICQVRFILI
jgi:hypothetical protein